MRTICTGSVHRCPVRSICWLGMSRGRWEGDTLVVDSIHFNDETWFDAAGNFHSDALHVVERYTRTGRDHIAYEVTIEDPKVFTRPWKMNMTLYRRQEQRADPGLRVQRVRRRVPRGGSAGSGNRIRDSREDM